MYRVVELKDMYLLFYHLYDKNVTLDILLISKWDFFDEINLETLYLSIFIFVDFWMSYEQHIVGSHAIILLVSNFTKLKPLYRKHIVF